jgi:EAL domain-containing protein (putative c-di-GMP-specific phosphodiesterase class I)
MSPAMFIPVAEESGQIVAIGRIVTEKVIEQMVLWREHGMTQRPVSINFSSRQMEDAGYVSYLKGLLSHYDISPEMIEIEITESILIKNNEKAMKLFDDFVSIGVSLVLDDFGTGYSSINYLTYIPVQKIKLDKLISDNYLQDGKEELIENIIRLIHSLGLKITVEGIEQEHQVERLRKFSCDYIQGYIYSKPVSGLEIEKSGL